MIFFVHGFNASAGSPAGRMLSVQAGGDVVCLEYDSALSFLSNLAAMKSQMKGRMTEADVIVGISLGGFYAVALAAAMRRPCVVLNPVTYPIRQMAQFIGRKQNLDTGAEYDFTQDVLNSYSECIDVYVHECQRNGTPVLAVCSENDSVLQGNAGYAREIFSEVQIIGGSTHKIEDFSPFVSTIKTYENLQGAPGIA